MGEPPAVLRQPLEETWKISAYDADVLVNQGRDLVAYFEELATLAGDGKVASNWMQQDVLRTLNERGGTIAEFPVRPAAVADIIGRITQGRLRHQPRPGDLRRSAGDREGRGRGGGRRWASPPSATTNWWPSAGNCSPPIRRSWPTCKGARSRPPAGLIGQAKKKNPNVNPGKVRAMCLELIQQAGRLGDGRQRRPKAIGRSSSIDKSFDALEGKTCFDRTQLFIFQTFINAAATSSRHHRATRVRQNSPRPDPLSWASAIWLNTPIEAGVVLLLWPWKPPQGRPLVKSPKVYSRHGALLRSAGNGR